MLTREHFRISGYADASPVFEVDAVVDPDQLESTIPRWMSEELGLRRIDSRKVDGKSFDYVGAIRLEGRACETCVPALVKGDAVVMGWLPLSSLVNEITLPGVYSLRRIAQVGFTKVKPNAGKDYSETVLGDEALLGEIPMQDMDVLINPCNERLMVPPERPNFALAKVK